tara:strand:- start:4355 stop:5626 length:1272 start_codon:yes stop_codon:yes gene_type:complete
MNFNFYQKDPLIKLFFLFIPLYFLFEILSGYLFVKQGLVSYLFGGFWVLYFILMYFKIGISKQNVPFIVFLLYIFFRVTMSSDFLTSLNQYATLFISVSTFIVAFKYFNNFTGFKMIVKISYIFLILYSFNIILSNLFLESSFKGYMSADEAIWHTGNVFTGGFNSIVYLLIAFPIIFPFIKGKKNKILYIVLLIAAVLTVLISLKRISILAIPVGYIVILFLNRNIFKTSKYIISFLLVIVFTFPLYEGVIAKQFEARQKTFDRGLQDEVRYLETMLVWNKALEFSPLSESFFGKEMFNSVDNYGLVDRQRMIHVDYNQLLHGGGFFGLFLFLFIHYYLIKKMRLYSRNSKFSNQKLLDMDNDKRVFFMFSPSIFYSFIIVSLFFSFAGGFHIILFNSIKFLFLGSILGIWYNFFMGRYNIS